MSKALLASTALTLLPAGAIFMMAGPADAAIQTLETKKIELHERNEAIVAKADAESRELAEDELAEIDQNTGEIEKLERQIQARQRVAAPAAGTGRKTAAEPAQPGAGNPRVTASPRASDPRGGFRSFGEFAQCVKAAHVGGDQAPAAAARLLNAATTYGNEGAGADGGFAVPAEFRRELWQKVMAEENLLTRCETLVTGSNNMTIPKDETTPWQTTGGIQVYWESEAGAVTQSKPQLQAATLRLAKLMALVPVTDELLDDAPGLESWLRAKAPQKMAAKVNTAIIRGTGVGQPLGLLNAGCLVSIAKETSQPADTIYFANINKMWARMWAPCRRNALWLINQDIEPQLDAMAFDPAATSKVPAYLPPGGLSASPYASLKGRPVVPIEACSTLGDQGDIILADLSQYWALRKAGQDIRTDVSIHLYFDQGATAFRFTFRVNGQPAWGSAITPQNGNNTRSCFVTLDERA